jgi:hypothetical protein
LAPGREEAAIRSTSLAADGSPAGTVTAVLGSYSERNGSSGRTRTYNSPVNRRVETAIWNDQTLSLLRAIDLTWSLAIPCHGRKNPI